MNRGHHSSSCAVHRFGGGPCNCGAWDAARAEEEGTTKDEATIAQCIGVMFAEKRASTSLFQRRLRLGYLHAARLMDVMVARGLIGPGEGAAPQQILFDVGEGSAREPAEVRGPSTAPVLPCSAQDDRERAGATSEGSIREVAWSKELPDEAGLWWWWNEDWDQTALPVSIMYSGTSNSFFASEGQWGWTRFQNVKEMGGYWMRCVEPEIPAR